MEAPTEARARAWKVGSVLRTPGQYGGAWPRFFFATAHQRAGSDSRRGPAARGLAASVARVLSSASNAVRNLAGSSGKAAARQRGTAAMRLRELELQVGSTKLELQVGSTTRTPPGRISNPFKFQLGAEATIRISFMLRPQPRCHLTDATAAGPRELQ